jgi:hypothetical protein
MDIKKGIYTTVAEISAHYGTSENDPDTTTK